jgi:hypothetical protein
VQVPAPQFPGYVKNVVTELYAPLRAAVNGSLTGEGTLGTVLLCEALISFLPSGMYRDQPTMLLRAYDVVVSCRVDDLRPYAEVKSGMHAVCTETNHRESVGAIGHPVLFSTCNGQRDALVPGPTEVGSLSPIGNCPCCGDHHYSSVLP